MGHVKNVGYFENIVSVHGTAHPDIVDMGISDAGVSVFSSRDEMTYLNQYIDIADEDTAAAFRS